MSLLDDNSTRYKNRNVMQENLSAIIVDTSTTMVITKLTWTTSAFFIAASGKVLRISITQRNARACVCVCVCVCVCSWGLRCSAVCRQAYRSRQLIGFTESWNNIRRETLEYGNVRTDDYGCWMSSLYRENCDTAAKVWGSTRGQSIFTYTIR